MRRILSASAICLSAAALTSCLGGKSVSGGGQTPPLACDKQFERFGVKLTWPSYWRSYTEAGAARSGGNTQIEILKYNDGSISTVCFDNATGGCARAPDAVVASVSSFPVFVQGFQPHVSTKGRVVSGSSIQKWKLDVSKASVTTARFAFDRTTGQPKLYDVVTKDLLTGAITSGMPTSCKAGSSNNVVGLNPESHTSALTGLTLIDEAEPLSGAANAFIGGYLRAGLVKVAGVLPDEPKVVDGVADPYRVEWVPKDFNSMDAYTRFGWEALKIGSEPVPRDDTSGVLPYFGHDKSDLDNFRHLVGSIDDRVIVGWCLEATKRDQSVTRPALLYVRNYLGKPLANKSESTTSTPTGTSRGNDCADTESTEGDANLSGFPRRK